jgi:hypothetical protein
MCACMHVCCVCAAMASGVMHEGEIVVQVEGNSCVVLKPDGVMKLIRYACIFVCECMCIHTYIHTYGYRGDMKTIFTMLLLCIHTYIHTYIRIHTGEK